jgi:hypothetical protein
MLFFSPKNNVQVRLRTIKAKSDQYWSKEAFQNVRFSNKKESCTGQSSEALFECEHKVRVSFFI